MKSGRKKRFIKTQLTWYSFIIVSLVVLLIFTYIPMLTSFRYSLYDISVVGYDEQFVGFDNYGLLLKSQSFHKSIGNTFGLAIGSLISIPIGFLLASLINSIGQGKAQSVFRIGYYLPNIITGVSVILIFQVVLKANGGLLNSFLSMLTRHDINIGWLTDSKHSWQGATILNVWQNLGYAMLINLASLQSISSELYEAAEIDGSSPFQRWLYITIPNMTSCFAFLFITGIINGMARFTDLYIISGNTATGRPGGTLQTILMYIYQYSFEKPQYGIASAGAMILFVLTFGITLVNLKMTGFFKKKS